MHRALVDQSWTARGFLDTGQLSLQLKLEHTAVIQQTSSLLRALWRSDPELDPESSAIREKADDFPRSAPSLAIPCLGKYRLQRRREPRRIELFPGCLSLWGWPSRGGVIVLDEPTPPDFDYLQLDPLDPTVEPGADQEVEDAFCRGLLRLGATWWDSQERHHFVNGVQELDERALYAQEAGKEPPPTRREHLWVRVAWPSSAPGSLYVVEYETNVHGFPTDKEEHKYLVPTDAGRVALARNMDERYRVLQRLGGTFYNSIEEYQGAGFLKAREDHKEVGEVELLRETSLEMFGRGSHLLNMQSLSSRGLLRGLTDCPLFPTSLQALMKPTVSLDPFKWGRICNSAQAC